MPDPVRPREIWRQDHAALSAALRVDAVAQRMRALSHALLGASYRDNPLGGGPGLVELVRVDLRGFDCVTLVEQVLAMARSDSAESFVQELTALRYRDGQVGWQTRLHYFSDWLEQAARRGALRPLGLRAERHLDLTLSTVPGLPTRQTRISVLPQAKILAAAPQISNGTVVAFASTRLGLDFFHVGLLCWEPKGEATEALTLVHASRSAGQVVAEPLRRFLDRNTTRGLTLAAPVELARP